MSKTRAQKKPSTLEQWNNELQWCATRKYVELLRSREELLSIDHVDVDVPQLVKRRFLCDSHRCIHWAEKRPLIDRSCCSRYDVPVTERDRKVIQDHLPAVRKNLPKDHRLQNPDEDPFRTNDDYGFELVHDAPLTKACQFTIYRDGMRLCALHMTAMQHEEDPREWKPVACSLWPLALDDYEADGGKRTLLTVYGPASAGIFEETDDEPFACIVDDHPSYPRLYDSERGTLEFIFGKGWWGKLDREARKLLGREARGG